MEGAFLIASIYHNATKPNFLHATHMPHVYGRLYSLFKYLLSAAMTNTPALACSIASIQSPWLAFLFDFWLLCETKQFFLHNCHTMTKYFVVNRNKKRKPNSKWQKITQKLQRQCHLWPAVCLLRFYYAHYSYYAVIAEVFCANFINISNFFFTNSLPLPHLPPHLMHFWLFIFTHTYTTVCPYKPNLQYVCMLHVCTVAICFVACHCVWLYCLVILLTSVWLKKNQKLQQQKKLWHNNAYFERDN